MRVRICHLVVISLLITKFPVRGCELGHQGALSRDAHLRLLAERCGVALATLQEAAREFAQTAETES